MMGKSKKITIENLYDMLCELKAELDSYPKKILKLIEITKLPKVCGNCKHWLKLDISAPDFVFGHCLEYPEDEETDHLHTCDKETASCKNFEYRIDEEE